jgi:predicted Mrr-cat superfamily restriction endonuclease
VNSGSLQPPSGNTAERGDMAQNQRAAWIIRAGQANQNQWALFRETGLVALSFFPVGDLTGKGRDGIAAAVAAAYPDRSEPARGGFTYQLDAFVNVMRPGDIVLTPTGGGSPALIGEIAGPYEYREEPVVSTYHHARAMNWGRTVEQGELPETARRALPSRRTITQIRVDMGELERVMRPGPPEVLHLLLKWRASEEPRTIDMHREVADRLGSVWWRTDLSRSGGARSAIPLAGRP